MNENRITLRSFALGIVVCVAFAIITVFSVNRLGMEITDTQIPVMPYVLLFLTVLLINPVCKLIRIARPFSAAEILIIFIMGMVSSGISTYGLSSQLVPFAGGLFNGAWNNEQSKWNEYIEPFVNEKFFVSEDGIRLAAMEHRNRLQEATKTRAVYNAALRLKKAEDRRESIRKDLQALLAAQRTGAEYEMHVVRVRTALRLAESGYEEARQIWEDASSDVAMSHAVILEQYPGLLETYDRSASEARSALAALEEKAFKKVEVFRSGLSSELRAVPGILPALDDDFSGYAARVRRLVCGRKSLRFLAAARRGSGAEVSGDAYALLENAVAALSPVADDAEIARQRVARMEELQGVRQASVRVADELEKLHNEKRMTSGKEASDLEGRIHDLNVEKEDLNRRRAACNKKIERIQLELEMTAKVKAAIAKIQGIQGRLKSLKSEELAAELDRVASQFHLFDGTLKRFMFGDIPWSHWVNPLVRWGILIALSYLVLMTFNVLIFRQWAHNEKLIYPLAELPERLAGVYDEEKSLIPALFKTGLFWVGVAIPVIFLGWNLICHLKVIPGLKELKLTHGWGPFIEKTGLEGLLPGAKSDIFFTMIGLSFLIPKKISFSLWFFSVLYMAHLLLMVKLGYGLNEASFPVDWWYTMNFRTALGGGALMVFASAVLFKCRRYIFCCFSPAAVSNLEAEERKELRLSSALFLMGSAGIILYLWLAMGANPYHTAFFFLVILLMTVGMVRAVTEGGLLGFQCQATPFHFIKTIFGMDKTWTAPALFAPLMIYFAVIFLDLKTFIAPAMANALKIRSDLKMRRRGFYLAMFAAISLAVVVAVLTEIILSYSSGANGMERWFYTQLPKGWGFGKIASISVNPPAAAPSGAAWVMGGGAAMAGLLFLRQFLFWLPHPIGMIMLVNPLMASYWFSILMGWIAKSLVTKYGGKNLYARMRCLFIGLIFGEVVMVALALFCSLQCDITIPITLNR